MRTNVHGWPIDNDGHNHLKTVTDNGHIAANPTGAGADRDLARLVAAQ